MRSVHAAEGWGWIRAARRRLRDAGQPASDPIGTTDRTFDLAQFIEAFDSALRSARRVIDSVSDLSLPAGHDWGEITSFIRRARNALEHGDERLAEPGFGYLFRRVEGDIELYDRPKNSPDWSPTRMPLDTLERAMDALEGWLDHERGI